MLSLVWFVTHTIQRYGRRGQALRGQPVLATGTIQKQQAAQLHQQEAQRQRDEQEIHRHQQEELKRKQEEELKKIQEEREAELKFQEEAEAQRRLEEELRSKQEAEAQRQKEEELKRQQEAEAERKRQEEAEAEKKRQEEEAAERKRQEEAEAEAERKRQEEAEAERKRQEEEAAERKRQEEAEAERKREEEAEAERKRQEEAEAEAERKRQEEAEAEAERKRQEEAEAEKKREEEEEAARKADEEKVIAPSEATPLSTSTKTVTLTPSVSGNAMSEQWAQQQVEKFSFTFDQADQDKNGSLSFTEVYNVIKSAGFRGSEEEAKFIFGHLDRDHDDKISKYEFTAAMNNLPRVNLKVFVLRKAFLTLDKDASGFLTRQEILDATTRDCGLDIAAEKISDLLLYLVKEDDDNKISFEEFLHVFGIEHVGNTMQQIFAKLDADGSGFLTRDEILAATRKENELSMYREKISAILLAWVKDTPSNKINYQDFVNIWKQQKDRK